MLTHRGTSSEECLELDDDVGLVFEFHDVGLAKTALLVVQAARYTWSITMSVGNCSCKIDEVWF